ncbi:hypothetical protein [Leptospira noguchii]|uniref:hypothetical protein n=1 Tax=Leptospira noguchii TaxID=28182 RepID=UPI001FB6C963|nr:hypothetical protein [Leptospira noguchii]UOG30768.1 hypothetical protein MAL06_01305 [Leptospira noguchii]UOG45328.1 hypothetical protein MAL01_01250 [Leptospira noguchii]
MKLNVSLPELSKTLFTKAFETQRLASMGALETQRLASMGALETQRLASMGARSNSASRFYGRSTGRI